MKHRIISCPHYKRIGRCYGCELKLRCCFSEATMTKCKEYKEIIMKPYLPRETKQKIKELENAEEINKHRIVKFGVKKRSDLFKQKEK